MGSSSMAIDIGIFNENDNSPVLSSVFSMVARSGNGPFKLPPLSFVDPADQVSFPTTNSASGVLLIKQAKAQAVQRLRSKHRSSSPSPLTVEEHEYIHNLFTVFAKVRILSH